MLPKKQQIQKAEEKKRQQQHLEKLKESIAKHTQALKQAKNRNKQLLKIIKEEEKLLATSENTLTKNVNQSLAEMDIKNSQIFDKVGNKDSFLKVDSKILNKNQNQNQKDKKEEQIRKQLQIAERLKLIKMIKYKKEVMTRLLEIKSDSGLYNSHKRVLIKEMLETIRKWNQDLENHNKKVRPTVTGYKEFEKKLQHYREDLQSYLKDQFASEIHQ